MSSAAIRVSKEIDGYATVLTAWRSRRDRVGIALLELGYARIVLQRAGYVEQRAILAAGWSPFRAISLARLVAFHPRKSRFPAATRGAKEIDDDNR
ncbi:MAG: hypothetical protein ABJC62_13750 [Frankiaceae bacterium]